MRKNLLIISLCFAALSFAACSKNESAPNANVNSTAGGGNVASNANANQSVSNANANANIANAAVKPAVDNSPQRISFGKGANWGTSNVTLAPNATRLFVVSAKAGQTMEVESSSKETAINLRKGKAETTEDFGYLNAELQGNGDYVFEVKNTSKKEVKTSIKVTIEGGNAKAESKDDFVPVDDDDQPLESNKKGNQND